VVRYPIMAGDELLTVAKVAQLFKLNQQTARGTGSTVGSCPVFESGAECESVGGDMEAFMEPAGPATPGVRPALPSTQAQAFWDT
jgi:hypothetical protein